MKWIAVAASIITAGAIMIWGPHPEYANAYLVIAGLITILG